MVPLLIQKTPTLSHNPSAIINSDEETKIKVSNYLYFRDAFYSCSSSVVPLAWPKLIFESIWCCIKKLAASLSNAKDLLQSRDTILDKDKEGKKKNYGS